MLDSLNDVSYTIPYLNVTITKDVVVEYARTHAQNGGPVFSIVLLVCARFWLRPITVPKINAPSSTHPIHATRYHRSSSASS